MVTNKPVDISDFKHLYPYESRSIKINNLRYNYIDEGEGEPLIMVHGNPTWSFYFRSLIDSLSGEYRTIAVDHIGCGLSEKPDGKKYDYTLKSRVDDLEIFIKSLNLDKKITLIVHDWGGMIALAYTQRNPESVSKLVITNTSGFLPPGNKGLPLRLWLLKYIKLFSKFGVLGFNLFAFAALYMAPEKKLSRDVKKGLIAPYNSWSNRIATHRFVQDIPLEEKDFSYNLVKSVDDNLVEILKDKPLLICWGENDFVFDMDYFAEWKKRFPQAKSHSFPEAGHYILEDIPEKVTSLIKDFLKEPRG